VSDDNLLPTNTILLKRSFISHTLARARENPWTVLFGAISFFLAIYAIYDAKNEPNLQVVFDPGTATKIVTALTPDIEVRYKGSVVAGEVSSQVIRFWNAGKHPIESQDILKQLQIKAAPDVTILDVRVKQQTRDVVTVAPMIVDKSTLSLTWRILENDDGGSIQVIYQGPSDSKFTVEGAVRGQKSIPANYLSPTKPEPSRLQLVMHKIGGGWSPLARFLTMLFLLPLLFVMLCALIIGVMLFVTHYFAKWFPNVQAPSIGWTFLLLFLVITAMVAVESGYIDSLTTSLPASIR
jgi:hypothetical protein